MAYRIHVTAVRDTTIEKVRSKFTEILGDNFANVPLVEHAGWISFRTSVWQVSSGDLIKGLQQLNQYGLQFTTEDGSRWYVTMCRPDTVPESMVHEFGAHGDANVDEEYYQNHDDYDDEYDVEPELAFLEDEPQTPRVPKTPIGRFAGYYSELGVPLPQPLLNELNSLSFADAIARFQLWHQEQLIEFLTSAGVHFDADAVGRVISWQGLTDIEHDSDLGNLPRLLNEIGLGEEWEKYITEAEAPQPEPEYETDDEPEEHVDQDPQQFINEVERTLGPLEPVPVSEGPVHLPLEKFADVVFFPEAVQIENEIRSMLTVELLQPFEQKEFDQLTAGASMDRANRWWVPGGFKLGFENQMLVNWRHFKKQLGLELTRFMEHLPDQSTLTLAFAAEDEPATHQMYRGKILNNVWQIDATYPSVPAKELSDALSLAAEASQTAHTLRDAAETDAVVAAVKKDSYLGGLDVLREGNHVSCEYDVEFLAKIIFRLRFRAYWNVEPYENHADQEYQQNLKMKWEFLRKSAKQAKILMAPRIGEPILRGEASIYWVSDLNHFRDLDPEIGEKFKAGMKSLNFSPLGDLNAKRFREYVLSFYLSSDRFSYADVTASAHGYLCWEFISDFSDGSRLTTTTLAMGYSRPAVNLFVKDFAGLNVEDLYEKHLHLITKFQEGKNATPVPLEATLAGVAKAFDDSLVRTDIDEANLEDEDEFDDDIDEEEYWGEASDDEFGD